LPGVSKRFIKEEEEEEERFIKVDDETEVVCLPAPRPRPALPGNTSTPQTTGGNSAAAHSSVSLSLIFTDSSFECTRSFARPTRPEPSFVVPPLELPWLWAMCEGVNVRTRACEYECLQCV
jgi:hypothetical protein